jgi:hypothetical protein
MRWPALALFLLLGACTTPIIQSDVTRFNALGNTQSLGFTIVPDQGQVSSLEFQDYATLVANALSAQGWRPVAPGGPADSVVSLHWGLGPPETVVWQSPSAVYGGMGSNGSYGGMSYGGWPGWYNGHVGYGFYDPFPYWETSSITTYPKWLSVRISEKNSNRVLFEGRAVAEGTRREIAPVMPYLVQALFTGFPGTNGSTVRVEMPVRQ